MVLFHDRQRDSKLGTLAQIALTLDFTLVEVNHLLDVGQTESEALHVVLVASMHTIELIEDFLDVLLLDALSGITDAEQQSVVFVPRADIDIEWLVGLAIFHGIVHQIGDGILEMHLIDIDG